MDVVGIASLAGSVFTALSVLFALFVYRRRQDQEAFTSFRTSLIDIQSNINVIGKVMTEASLSEIGFCIGEQLRAIYPNGCTKQDVIKLFTDDDMQNYVVTAMHIGVRDAVSTTEAFDIIDDLQRLPFQHQSQLPLTSAILKECLSILSNSVFQVSSVGMYSTALFHENNREILEEQISRLEDIDNIDLVFRDMGEFI
jgi:hypothetical protein